MSYPKIPLAQQVIQLCHAKNVHHVVISPGSRNAPLTIGFSAHPTIKTYSIVDERCAAFLALGMAQQLQKPVAVVCTSGSALLNYYPAIAEAYYSNIPLIVISADRPKHLIDIGDGQTIRQENIFEKHVLFSANLKQGLNENDERFSQETDIPSFVLNKLLALDTPRLQTNEKLINTAINIATAHKGPVHINVPFAEPLYETQNEFSEDVSVIAPEVQSKSIDTLAFKTFVETWNKSKKRLVLVGVNLPNAIDQRYLDYLGSDNATVVFTESTSNMHHANFFPSIDQLIAPLTEEEFTELQPDVLLTLGGLVVSKKIKTFLRHYQPKAHYHLGNENGLDTFFCLKHHFKHQENLFFKAFFKEQTSIKSDYQSKWLLEKSKRLVKHNAYLKTIPFSDFKVFETLLNHIPAQTLLHLSNSSTIRYVQLFNSNPTVNQFCNRGTSGIDGSTSTAIGHAIVSNTQNILITGDLSFFYDSNGLWNNYIPNNFRIIVINNSGGGIFRILPGQKNTENFETYFETKHNLTAAHLCKMHNINYKSASNVTALNSELESFFLETNSPALLEVFTPRELNDTVLINYFKCLGEK
ncbi:MAG: 2-succinyl-5-enolpyruvyl-6-hydroxy-3-cyclohexene-1-carboxylate synthase [Flavobacteriaceae bacterium]